MCIRFILHSYLYYYNINDWENDTGRPTNMLAQIGATNRWNTENVALMLQTEMSENKFIDTVELENLL